MAWCTTELVSKLTGKTVTDEELAVATGVIELASGILQDQYPVLYGRDAAYVARTVAYQAAWMQDRDDYFDRDDVTTASQDGQGVTWKGTGIVLAPLAAMSLRRVSWRGTRSTSQTLASQTRRQDPQDDDIDAAGRTLKWEPLP